MEPEKYRTVIYSEDVERFVDSCAGQYARFRELWDALEMLLSRKPEVGMRVPYPGEKDWRVVQTAAWPHQGVPVVELGYWYTDGEVHFEFCRIKP